MKRFFLILFTIAAVSHGWGAASGAPETRARNKRVALQLFIDGKTAAAVAQVRNSGQPEKGPDGSTTAFVQDLVGISNTLYNQGHRRAAREAALQALVAAEPIVNGRSGALEKRRKDLHASLAVLCEQVLNDLDAAQAYYAVAAQMSVPTALDVQRVEAVKEKIKLREKGGKK